MIMKMRPKSDKSIGASTVYTVAEPDFFIIEKGEGVGIDCQKKASSS